MLRPLSVLAVLLLLASPLLAVGQSAGAGEPERYIVGYKKGEDQAAHLAIHTAGGSVQRSSPELGFAVVETDRPDEFQRVVRLSPSVQYVERDDPIGLAGAQWNGAQWNGAQWNGAQWNGAQWNGAQWNGAQWNSLYGTGPQWFAPQWLAHHWTRQQYLSNDGTSFHYDTATSDPGLVWQWGVWATDLHLAWAQSTGTRGAKLCVLDSGLAWDRPDVAANAWTGSFGERGWNAMDPVMSAYDDAGHGTHVSGVAAAVLGNSFGVAGAGNVLLLPVKVLDSTGHGHESDLAFGLAWCAQQGADVALMALSATEPGPTLDRALAYAHGADVLLVASAGNGGPCAECVSFPASDPRVLAVSAVDGNLTLAPFSGRGADVELAAPGVHVLGPLHDGAFAFGSGTSQAAALVAGVAALVRDANPHLGAAQARQALLLGAQDLGPAGRDASFGHGLLDADGALAAARTL